MSGFTTQIRTIIEHYSQDTPNIPFDQKIEKGRKGLFNFEYPFFDPKYKPIFETNFIKYFYMHEIGQETEGLFKLRLDMWLNINMFYFNKLFESEQLTYNPLENVNVKKDRKRQASVDSTSKSSSESSEEQTAKQSDKNFVRDIQSDTPEERLQLTTGADGTGVIEYASAIGENKSNGSSDSSGKRSGTSSGQGNATSEMDELETESHSGKIGSQSYQDMILQYRKTFVNVERQIFEQMRKDGLFMLIYN